ncbi:MAG: chemotaxis response regulator protein-glutamate methylesterase [Proteobacteria bacterium]|nr:chemotaxis response regulator protein-glutamate methylesterase [Pseudomonadota bacterium]
MIRVLVVDDSSFMRQSLKRMLETDPQIEVVATARDGLDGLEKVQKLNPDVVTLDVEMPRLDGLGALARIMATSPRPVIMISSLTTEGARATLSALDMGAVDFIPKDLGRAGQDIVTIRDQLIQKVKAVAGRRVRSFLSRAHRKAAAPAGPMPSVRSGDVGLVAVGASTGGPPALQTILTRLPAHFPAPLVIVQHMPPAFTGPFAQRLDSVCALTVSEASHGQTLQPGHALVAPGGKHLTLRRRGTRVEVVLSDEPAKTLHRPSADVMMSSAAATYRQQCLGVILTGMGHDGQEGMAAIKRTQGRTLAQDEASCVVYGMPRAVVEAGLADAVVDLENMARVIGRVAESH